MEKNTNYLHVKLLEQKNEDTQKAESKGQMIERKEGKKTKMEFL